MSGFARQKKKDRSVKVPNFIPHVEINKSSQNLLYFVEKSSSNSLN